MTTDLIQDHGRGPEVVGTRITVYNLLQSFLDPTVTECEICRVYDLTAQQVAARAYYSGGKDGHTSPKRQRQDVRMSRRWRLGLVGSRLS